jgi:hypothetical protein
VPARRPFTLVLAAALLLGTAACNGDEPRADPTTTAPATSAPPATTAKTIPPSPLLDSMAPLVVQIPELQRPDLQPIFEDFVRTEQAVLKAGMSPVTPDDPEVAARHDGEQLTLIQNSLAKLKEQGRALGLPTAVILEPRSVPAMNDHEIQFYACITIEQAMLDVSTGQVVQNLTGSELMAIGMKRVDGRWRMTLRTQKPEWEGKSCADALRSSPAE